MSTVGVKYKRQGRLIYISNIFKLEFSTVPFTNQFLVKLHNCLGKLIWCRLRSASFSSEGKFVYGSKNSKHFFENENSTSGGNFFKILALRIKPPLFYVTPVWFLIDSNRIRIHNHKACKRTVNHISFLLLYFYPSYRGFFDYPWVN